MQYIDDIELIGGSIHGAKIENLNLDPDFFITDSGRIYFNISGTKLRLNNGVEWIDLSLPSNFSNLITTLGANWINTDFTFNPTEFNALTNITGLTSNDSLFDVISQLDNAINSNGGSTLLSLNDVAETTVLDAGDLLYYNGDNFTFTNIDAIIQTYGHINFSGLEDVSVTGAIANDIIVYDGANYVPANPFFFGTDYSSVIEHTIIHTLGVQLCGITVINANTFTVINDATIVFTDINTVDITLQIAAPIYVVLVSPLQFGGG
jgi:hypothetical protein